MSKRGFLRKGALEEDNEDSEGLEETYMRMFPKIGRDFVHKDDLTTLFSFVFELLGLSELLNGSNNDAAIQRALEYKAMLDKGESGNKIYPDLITLDD